MDFGFNQIGTCKMTKAELMLKITKGERLSSDEDDLCYALFTPEEYAKIPDELRPPIPSLDDAPDISDDPTTPADDLQEIKRIVKGIAAVVSSKNMGDDDPVLIALKQADHMFKTVDPTSWVDAKCLIEWYTAHQSVTSALAMLTLTRAPEPSKSARGKPIRCIQDGIAHASIAAAATAYGIPPTSISNHLSGRYGFASVKGLTFERITTDG